MEVFVFSLFLDFHVEIVGKEVVAVGGAVGAEVIHVGGLLRLFLFVGAHGVFSGKERIDRLFP